MCSFGFTGGFEELAISFDWSPKITGLVWETLIVGCFELWAFKVLGAVSRVLIASLHCRICNGVGFSPGNKPQSASICFFKRRGIFQIDLNSSVINPCTTWHYGPYLDQSVELVLDSPILKFQETGCWWVLQDWSIVELSLFKMNWKVNKLTNDSDYEISGEQSWRWDYSLLRWESQWSTGVKQTPGLEVFLGTFKLKNHVLSLPNLTGFFV